MNKAVAYDYTFNYFGGDTYEGKVVAGASITLAIRCYKGDTDDTNPSLSQKLPKGFQDLPVCEPVEVTENVFKEFISSHIDDFDISDNKRAQSTSVSFVD